MRRILALAALLGIAAAARADERGAALFAQHCAPCHQAAGEGAPGLAPPIAGTLAGRAGRPVGRAYLAQVLVSGLAGPIVVGGERFSGVMPGFAKLSDEDLQAVFAHLLGALNGSADHKVSGEEIAAARRKALSPNETRRLRDH
ncbi:MAG: cytochrome c [Pseudomonadota bacterium]|jgi:mono/diheme cytochrome c family protein